MNWSNPQVIKFILFLLFLTIGAIGWIMRKLNEQRLIRNAEHDRQRRFEDSLRTGRGGPGAQPASPGHAPQMPAPSQTAPSLTDDPRERLKELARRRQQEIEAERQGQAGAPIPGMTNMGPAATPGRQPPIIVMGPNGPIIIPRPQTAPAPASPPSPQHQRQQQQSRTPRPPKQQAQKQPRPQPPKPSQQQPQQRPAESESTSAYAIPEPSRQSAARAVARVPLGRNRAEIRRAIVLMETLSPPLSLRPGGTDERAF